MRFLAAAALCFTTCLAQQAASPASRPVGFVLPAATPLRYGETVRVEIGAEAPVYPGLGRCRVFEFPAAEGGAESTVFVAAEGAGSILSLRLEDAASGAVLVADDRRVDAACVRMTFGKPRRVALVVADASPGPSSVELGLRRCDETEESLTLARELSSIAEKAAAAVAQKRSDDARELIAEAVALVNEARDRTTGAVAGHRWADIAFKLAFDAKANGGFADAVALLEPVLGVLTNFYPEWAPSFALVALELGTALARSKRGAEAVPRLETAVRILERRRPQELLTQRARSELAALLDAAGQRDRSRTLFEAAYQAFRDDSAADPSERRRATNNFAQALANAGRHAEAQRLYEESLQGSDSRPGDLRDRAARIGRGDALRNRGYGAEAAAVFERELADAERRAAPESHELRFKLALSLTVAGFPREALPHARAAAEALSARSPTSVPALNARFVLALTMSEAGDCALALDAFDRLDEAASGEFPPHDLLRRNVAINAANAAAALGDTAGAVARYERLLRALEGQENVAVTEAIARTNLAQRLRSIGRLEQALAEARRALGVLEAHPEATSSEQRFAAHAGVATVLMSMERHDEALAEYDRAVADAGEAAALRTVDRMNRAICLQVLGRREESLTELRDVAKAVDARNESGSFERTRAWLNVAAVAADLGRGDECVAATLRMTDGVETAAEAAPWRGARAGFEAAVALQDAVLRAWRTHARGFGGEPLLRAAFDASAALRAAPFRTGALWRAAASSPERRQAVDAVRVAQAAVATTAPDSTASPEALAKAVATRDRLQRETTATLGLDPRAGETNPKPPAGAAYALVARTTHYLPQDLPGVRKEEVDRYEALVRTPDGATRRIDLGRADELDDAVEAVHAESEAVAAAAERRLAGVAAALGSAAPGARRLYVTLDDGLQAAPLDASFPSREKPGPELVVLPSFDAVAESRPRRAAAGKIALAVFGGVDYGTASETEAASRGLGTFAPLPESAAESQDVEAAFAAALGERAEVRRLGGRTADRTAVFSAMLGATYVHLATHGWFAPETLAERARHEPARTGVGDLRVATFDTAMQMTPLALSGVALSGANAYGPGRREGLASGEDFAAADLSGAELCVLSACRSGVGLRRTGQCVQSLQTAFHLAGARTTIAAVARVDDAATRALMAEFYGRLWRPGATKLSAFREARAALRDAKDPTTGRPRYRRRDWSAWVMSGMPD